MKPYFILTLSAVAMWMASCGQSNDSLAKKKDELAEIRKEIAALESAAKKLEAEIGADTTGEAQVKTKLVQISEAKTGVFRGYLDIHGTVDAEESTIATAQMPGVVINIPVQNGQKVSKGQTLAELDNSIQRQQVAQIQQQVDFMTTLYEKQKSLWEKGIGTEVQYLNARNQKEAMEKNLATAKEQLNMTRIKSPITGTIDEVNIKVGQSAAPGLPLFRVINLSGVKVVANVAETYIGKIKQGDAIRIYFPDLNQEKTAKVSFVAGTIDPVNRSFQCEARLGDGSNLKPNMLAVVRITEYENNNAVTVPLNVVQKQGNRSMVYVAEKVGNGWVARMREVEAGRSQSGEVEIRTGIKPGDQVIVTGFQELSDGQAIRINAE
jgi:membrane fusion protein, multidrug efflux system